MIVFGITLADVVEFLLTRARVAERATLLFFLGVFLSRHRHVRSQKQRPHDRRGWNKEIQNAFQH